MTMPGGKGLEHTSKASHSAATPTATSAWPWHGKKDGVTPPSGRPIVRREAEEFLRENLSAPAAAKDMEEHARAVGISSRTLARARKRLGVIAEKGGMDKGWTWHLPG